jgi:hypothetical protein
MRDRLPSQLVPVLKGDSASTLDRLLTRSVRQLEGADMGLAAEELVLVQFAR